MMKNDFAVQFLVGAFTALTNAVINVAVLGQINWPWVIVAFVVPFGVLFIYQNTGIGFAPFKRWKIREDQRELRCDVGTRRGDVWEFDSSVMEGGGFYGPYQPLSKGKYRVAFRLKIDSNVVREQVSVDTPVVELEVTSNDGQKYLAHRSLTIGDFLNSDDYQEFPLDSDLVRDENRVEFRLRMKNVQEAQRRITFDAVIVSKRLI